MRCDAKKYEKNTTKRLAIHTHVSKLAVFARPPYAYSYADADGIVYIYKHESRWRCCLIITTLVPKYNDVFLKIDMHI